MTTAPLKTLISAVQNTQDDLLTLKWARKRLFSVISVFAVILGFKGGGYQGIARVTDRNFSRMTPGFFVSVGSLGVLGRTTYPGLPVSTYRRPVAAILPQAVWR